MIRDQSLELRALQDTIYVIGGKWRLPIINALCNGHHHFREIERSIPGLSRRMLSKELRELELNNLVIRHEDPFNPNQVRYELTPFCNTFAGIIQQMINWGMQYRSVLLQKTPIS